MTTVIGIAGPSFCGSTLLSFMLGELHGVRAAGETHWLYTRPAWQKSPGMSRGSRCTTHGDGCAVFTPSRREQLGSGPSPDWYASLATLLGTDTLVVSDKTPRLYQRHAPGRFLFPMKDPRALVASFRHNATGHPQEPLRYARSIARSISSGPKK